MPLTANREDSADTITITIVIAGYLPDRNTIKSFKLLIIEMLNESIKDRKHDILRSK